MSSARTAVGQFCSGPPDNPRAFKDAVMNLSDYSPKGQRRKGLEHVAFIDVPAVAHFEARTVFHEDTVVDGIRFAKFGKNFKTLAQCVVELYVPARRLEAVRLTEHLTNEEIHAAAGEGTQVALAHVFELLKLQPNGEISDGMRKFLRVGLYEENIFHVEGTNWVVRVEQEGGGWHPGANLITEHNPPNQDGGNLGDIVFLTYSTIGT